MKSNASRNSLPPIYCGLCGREIPSGSRYWHINGQSVCPACLGDFARQEFAPCLLIHGEEERL